MKIETNAPIDFVVTWVDGEDPAWCAQKAEWLAKVDTEATTDWLAGDKRYRDWGLLRYWFRGVEECASWVRTVHFVTWGHLPEWLDTANPKLHVVRHEDYIPKRYLPTFNSHTIEFNMHRIPGLGEQFVYFNDDMYLLKEVHEKDFFKEGLPRDFAGLNLGTLGRKVTSYEPFNAMVINEHFDKNEVIQADRLKWLNPLYGLKVLCKTLLLMPFSHFSAMQTDHLPISFLKSTFEKVWSVEGEILDMSCLDKFRSEIAVSPWLMRDWQRAEGKFVPRRVHLDGFLDCGNGPGLVGVDTVKKCIAGKIGGAMICLNDAQLGKDEFEDWSADLMRAFSLRFPKKSGFEK